MTCNEVSSLYIICGLIVPTAYAAVYIYIFVSQALNFALKIKILIIILLISITNDACD